MANLQAKGPGHPYAETRNISFKYYTQTKSPAPFGYDYFISLPPAYSTSSDKKYPLLLFLHGAGESQRGENESYATLRHGVPKIILCYDRWKGGEVGEDGNPSVDIPLAKRLRGKNPNRGKAGDADLASTSVSTEVCSMVAEEFITITPSLNMGMRFPFFDNSAAHSLIENGYGWNPVVLTALLDEVISAIGSRIHDDRIHVTGFSMGGYGTWELALHPPNIDRFASLMPICGGGDHLLAKNIKNVPQWVHHGELDDIIPIGQSERMVKALRAAGAGEEKVKFSRYPNLAHDSWTEAYGQPEVWKWVLQQRRGST